MFMLGQNDKGHTLRKLKNPSKDPNSALDSCGKEKTTKMQSLCRANGLFIWKILFHLVLSAFIGEVDDTSI